MRQQALTSGTLKAGCSRRNLHLIPAFAGYGTCSSKQISSRFIVRKILGQLKAAGLVEVARGSGGASIPKPLNEISFLDIYNAVECIENGELFHFHENPNTDCPVGRNIHAVLDDKKLLIWSKWNWGFGYFFKASKFFK